MAEKADNLESDRLKDQARSSSAPLVGEEPAGSSDGKLSHIRKEIRQTEAEMAATLAAIEEKLAPSHLLDQAKGKIIETVLRRSEAMMETAGNKMSNMGEKIRQKVENNPIPVTLLGLGLGWLMVDAWKRRDERHGWIGGRYYRGDREESLQEFYESELYPSGRSVPQSEDPGQARQAGGRSAKEALNKAQETGARYAAQLEQKVRHYGEEAQQQVGELKERASHLTGEARHRYRRARVTFSQLMQENPLMVGAAALAAGALAGLLIPETHREREWMGETRDALLQKGYQVGREVKEKATKVVRETGRAAADEAERQKLTAEGTMEKVEKVVDEALHTAADSLEGKAKNSSEGI